MSERFFSDVWHRVEGLRPALRSHIRVHRHRYGGQAWYVLEDRVAGRSHRLSLAAYHLAGRMDGRRRMEEIWAETVDVLGEAAPSQDDVVGLLGQLHGADLLRSDASPDTLELLERRRKHDGKLVKQNLMGPTSFKLPLFDPDALLTFIDPVARRLVGPVGLILWAALAIWGGVVALENWGSLSANFSDRLLSMDNVLIMAAVYPIVKAIHELAHGVVAKAYGAEVRETGIMFLVFFPVPYVDASGANAFRSKWRRAAVAMAGIMAELAIAAVAMILWADMEPGLARAALFNAITICGLSTLLVNGNPLLKFDGYHAMADVIEMPNLAGRASKFWGHLVDRYAFGAHALRDFHATAAEKATFLVYAPAAFAYRIWIGITIALFIAESYFVVGVLLAALSLTMSLGLPVGKALWHVATGPRIRRQRRRAVALTGGLIAAAALLIGLVPAPLSTTAEGVLWAPEESRVRAGAPGLVAEVSAGAGAEVSAGAPLFALREPAFEAELRVLEAAAAELDLKWRQERVADPVLAAVTRLELDDAEAELASARARQARRLARAPAAGRFEPAAPPENMIGRWVSEGDLLGHVLADRPQVIRAVVTQADVDLVRASLRGVRVLLPGRTAASYPSEVVREVAAGGFQLPSPALGLSAGGRIPTDPQDQEGRRALARVFEVEIAAPPEAAEQGFGARVSVKFEHAPEPLARILWRRARQLFLDRFET